MAPVYSVLLHVQDRVDVLFRSRHCYGNSLCCRDLCRRITGRSSNGSRVMASSVGVRWTTSPTIEITKRSAAQIAIVGSGYAIR